MWPNPAFEGSAEQRRRSVPSSLRSSALAIVSFLDRGDFLAAPQSIATLRLTADVEPTFLDPSKRDAGKPLGRRTGQCHHPLARAKRLPGGVRSAQTVGVANPVRSGFAVLRRLK